MIFVYGAVLLSILWLVLSEPRQSASKKQFAILIAVTTFASAFFSLAVPIAELPAPAGPLLVGTRYLALCDEARSETLVQNGQKRRFMTQIWYPCEQNAEHGMAPYMQSFGDWSPFKQSFVPSLLASHLPLIKTHSILNARFSNGEMSYPVLIFSHGMMGGSIQNTVLAEHLASNGYIVIAPDHTYDCSFAIFPNETVCSLLLTKIPPPISQIASAGLEERVGDVEFLIEELNNSNSKQLDLDIRQHSNLNQVGIYGHSLGGQTAFLSAANDTRVKAVASLDGVPRRIAAGIRQPVLLLLADDKPTEIAEYISEFTRELAGSKDILICKNFGHADFTDMILLTPFHWIVGMSGRVSSETAISTVNSYVLSFFNKHLKMKKDPVE